MDTPPDEAESMNVLLRQHAHRLYTLRLPLEEVLIVRHALGLVLDHEGIDDGLREVLQPLHTTLVQRLGELHTVFLTTDILLTSERPAAPEFLPDLGMTRTAIIEQFLAQFDDKTLRFDLTVWDSLNVHEAFTHARQRSDLAEVVSTTLRTLQRGIEHFLRRLDPRFLDLLEVDGDAPRP